MNFFMHILHFVQEFESVVCIRSIVHDYACKKKKKFCNIVVDVDINVNKFAY